MAQLRAVHLAAGVDGPRTVLQSGNVVFGADGAGIGRSRLTGAVIEMALGTLGTARNRNTLTKVAALAETLESGAGRST